MYFSDLTFLVTILALINENVANVANYKNLEDLLEAANEQLLESTRFQNVAYWNFSVNMTNSSQDMYIKTALFEAKIWQPLIKNSLKFDSNVLEDESLRRQLKILQGPTIAVLSNNDYGHYLKICTDMERLFGEARICSYENKTNCNLSCQADLMQIFAKQRNSDMLKFYWETFYNELISKTKKQFLEYIFLYRKAVIVSNFKDIEEWWIAKYDQLTIRVEIFGLYRSLAPFYFQLHAYVRHRLRLFYGSEKVSLFGPIPMHLLGSIWAEEWSNIQDITLPYPKERIFDVTNEMIAQNYSVVRMFKIADEFMQSLGLRKLPRSLWRNCIGKPNPKLSIYCRARSFDFYKNDDVCVRSCTAVSHKGFQSVYHQMGHLQYFLQYAKKPFLLRNSPSPDLHEAIGDVIALAAMSPKYLQQIGLLKNYTYNEEARINYLFRMALEKIVFIPFALSTDEFFLTLLRNQIEPEYFNCAYWQKREDFTGVMPPVERKDKHFDVFANYYISGDVELLRYIKAIVLQFELYKIACDISKETYNIPALHLENCNFYKNQEVGKAFQTLLATGAEKHWLDIVHTFGSKGPLSDAAIQEYFKPLIKWLEKTNQDNNITIGWSPSQSCLKVRMSKAIGIVQVQESVNLLFYSAFSGLFLFQNFY